MECRWPMLPIRGSGSWLSATLKYLEGNAVFVPKSENGRGPPITGRESRLETGGVNSLPPLFRFSTARSTSADMSAGASCSGWSQRENLCADDYLEQTKSQPYTRGMSRASCHL